MNDTPTPVGERPATGGHVRRYESDSERARAWRQRQKERRAETPGGPVPPTLAEATLASVLERLAEVLTANSATAADLVSRAEEAIGVLADPEAVTEEMEAVRAETARQVAEAQERQSRAQQAKALAESTAREAENAANSAWEQVEALTAQLEQERSAGRELQAAAASAAEALQAAQRDHLAAMGEQDRRHAGELADLAEVHRGELYAQRDAYERAALDLAAQHRDAVAQLQAQAAGEVEAAETLAGEAERDRARAEGVAGELRGELERTRSDLDRARVELAELPGRVEAAEAAVTENLSIRHRLELDATKAGYEGQIGRLQAQLESAAAQVASAERIAEVYQREAEILAQQVDRPGTQRRRPRPSE